MVKEGLKFNRPNYSLKAVPKTFPMFVAHLITLWPLFLREKSAILSLITHEFNKNRFVYILVLVRPATFPPSTIIFEYVTYNNSF